MRFIASKTYYRSAQVCSILLFPALAAAMVCLQVEDYIVTDGMVKCRKQAILVSPLKDTLVRKLLVQPGERVAAGQVLARLADLQCWQEQLEKKRLQSAFLHRRLQAMTRLRRQGLKSGIAENEVALQASSTDLEIKSLKRRIGRLTVRAPFAGTVTGIAVEEGQPVTIGAELMEIASLEHKIIECHVPEKRYADLRRGQAVAVKSNLLNYLKYDVYAGKVESFEAYGFSRGADVSFKVTIALDARSSAALKVGTTARCEIMVDKAPLYLRLLEGRR